jgi:hypothetical protein
MVTRPMLQERVVALVFKLGRYLYVRFILKYWLQDARLKVMPNQLPFKHPVIGCCIKRPRTTEYYHIGCTFVNIFSTFTIGYGITTPQELSHSQKTTSLSRSRKQPAYPTYLNEAAILSIVCWSPAFVVHDHMSDQLQENHQVHSDLK